MGSRYLLVEFDEEKDALKLKSMLDERTRVGRPLRVVALFAKPTRYCECPPEDKVTTKTNQSILARGKKFGWWVCTICKRPDSQISGLRNLLKPRDIINPMRWKARGLRDREYTFSHYIDSLNAVVVSEQAEEFWNEV